jgi:nicotinamidase/pyrazinamidase
VVFSRDWHQVDGDNGGHFALPPSAPDFEDAWPVHCVQGTAGATYHPAIRAAQERLRATTTDVVHVVKGEGRPDYSIAQGRVADADGGPAPEDAPRSLATLFTGPIDVVGLAYDYCVRASALDIERCPGAGPVRVLTDLTAAVHPEADDRTAADLTAHGIRPETSAKADAADVHHHSRSSVRKEA